MKIGLSFYRKNMNGGHLTTWCSKQNLRLKKQEAEG
jgi:hypothetical protein